jgi:glycoprotein endo-alpha-1,2-mannosidase
MSGSDGPVLCAAEGRYYDRMWEAAIDALPDAVSVTSFNEWGEGTQIEPAVPHVCMSQWRGNKTHLPVERFLYRDYSGNPYQYLEQTKGW